MNEHQLDPATRATIEKLNDTWLKLIQSGLLTSARAGRPGIGLDPLMAENEAVVLCGPKLHAVLVQLHLQARELQAASLAASIIGKAQAAG